MRRKKSRWCPYAKKLRFPVYVACSKESCEGCEHNKEEKAKCPM